jgi:large subunit ribosomal protein L31e
MSEPEPKEEVVEEEKLEEPAGEATEPVAEKKAPVETAPAAEAEEAEGEEEIEVVEEKIYTIPLRHVWVVTPRGKRAPRAVRDVRDFVARHMKAEEVAMSNEVNAALWSRSINKPPRKITVRAVKDKEGKVIVYPAKAA